MRAGCLLLLCWLYPVSAWADEQALQYLHEIRTRSYLLCSSAMLYFNPAIHSPDPRTLASTYDSLARLQTRTVQLGQPPIMVANQRSMQVLVKALEQLPRDAAGQYPEKVAQLLKLQRQVDAWTDQQYRKASGSIPRLGSELHQQSLGMARMLLDYQARSYALPDADYVALSDAELGELDRLIGERFDRLLEQGGEAARTFGSIRSNYRFVRARLLDRTAQQSSGGIEFYLTRGIIDLDELATELLAESASGQVQPL